MLYMYEGELHLNETNIEWMTQNGLNVDGLNTIYVLKIVGIVFFQLTLTFYTYNLISLDQGSTEKYIVYALFLKFS